MEGRQLYHVWCLKPKKSESATKMLNEGDRGGSTVSLEGVENRARWGALKRWMSNSWKRSQPK
jgi:hypothetical protein